MTITGRVNDELNERQALSDLAGKTELRLGLFSFCLRANRTMDRFTFENADCRCSFDRRAQGAWVLEVIVRAVYLATHTPEQSLALAASIADEFGRVIAARLRRVDVCADFTNLPLLRSDADRILSRARVTAFRPESKDVDEVERPGAPVREYYGPSRVITGITVGAGGESVTRAYDKTAELVLPGREAKKEIEESIWRAAGWTTRTRVTRVELQLRGSALDELDLRDPAQLVERLDPVWQYGTRATRLVRPRTATRLNRARLDTRWAAVQQVVFRQLSPPAKRSRHRGGASAPHVLGNMLSLLGATGKLRRFDEAAGGLEDAPHDRLESMLDEQLNELTDDTARELKAYLVKKYGLRGAVIALREKIGGTIGRFFSADDVEDEKEP